MSDVVSIRMYNVGFGDCMLIRVRRGDVTWRMLVDCGVHSQGARQDIDEVVDLLVGHLADECEGKPRLDVVVATHRHADHVKGFESERWRDVEVGEVWLPFVEDKDDPDAQSVRRGIDRSSTALLGSARHAAAVGGSPALRVARELAENARPNQGAMDRLLQLSGKGFAGPHRVRYWPNLEPEDNKVALHGEAAPLRDSFAHIVGPPRDPEFLRRMAPPKSAEWLHLTGVDDLDGGLDELFPSMYRVAENDLSAELRDARRRSALANLNVLDETLLAAAVQLDRVVNNTSVFIVLEVGDIVIVLPGDAQQGAWEYVRSAPAVRRLLSKCTVYKIGHHGSHNATPRAFLDEDWDAAGGFALLPWGKVERWPSIPKEALMSQLAAQHTVLRFDATTAAPNVEFDENDNWVEVTLPTH